MKHKKEKMSPSKPKGTGATRLKFNEKAAIAPTENAKKANPGLQMDMFGKDALGAEIPANGKYAAKSKKGNYNAGMCSHKPNKMLPTSDY